MLGMVYYHHAYFHVTPDVLCSTLLQFTTHIRSYGSEHWYGGGGITRKVTLLKFPAINIVEQG
jgi:hypothetical protein